MERICIYPKDVQIVTGRSETYGRSLIRQIKKKLSKSKHQFVSIDEFCNHTGLEKTSILATLKY